MRSYYVQYKHPTVSFKLRVEEKLFLNSRNYSKFKSVNA